MTDTSEAPAVQLRPAKMRAVAQLVAWARNARTHSEEQIAVIAASITEFGWTNPVLVDGNQILAGHGRVLAAVSLGLEKIPCINLGGLSDIQKRAYVVADNRIAELAVTTAGSSGCLTSGASTSSTWTPSVLRGNRLTS